MTQAYREFTDAEINGLIIVEWDDITGPAQAYSPRALSGFAASVQVQGDFASGVVSLMASNDGVNYHVLPDVEGNPIQLSEAGMREVSTAAAFIRPDVPAGATVSVTMAFRS